MIFTLLKYAAAAATAYIAYILLAGVLAVVFNIGIYVLAGYGGFTLVAKSRRALKGSESLSIPSQRRR